MTIYLYFYCYQSNKKSTSEVISISGLKQFKFQPLKCQFMETSTNSPRSRLWQYWELIKIPFGGQIYFLIRICWYISRANIDKRRGGFFPLSDIFSHRRLKILALNCEEALKPRRLGLKGWVVINLWICDTSWGSKTFFFDKTMKTEKIVAVQSGLSLKCFWNFESPKDLVS